MEMESKDYLESFPPAEAPSSPVIDGKLKRLKEAKTLMENSPKLKTLDSEKLNARDFEEPALETLDLRKSTSQVLEESNSRSQSGSEGFEDEDRDGLYSGREGLGVEEHVSGAKRTLDFNSAAKELHGRGEDQFDVMEAEKETEDMRVEQSAKKRQNNEGLEEKKDKKKRVRRVRDDEKPESAVVSKRTEKERREQLKQLRADSQRLLRGTRDAAFKSAPLVQKPISSVLEKIRQRKLEVSKKSVKVSKTSFVDYDDDDGDFSREFEVSVDFENAHTEDGGDEKTTKIVSEEAISCPANVDGASRVMFEDPPKNTANPLSHEILQTQMAVDEECKQAFRAPINDTQDLFSDSQAFGSNNELPDETPNSPLEEVLAPSLLAMNLKLGSAPPDDISSDEEDNDKENIDPSLQKSDDLSSSPNGDPVKAFVDDEAEEEDDSDNDLFRFEDNEEDEDIEDAEELKDMIATEYKEKQIDTERRNELHQKWLEQQDAAGTEKLLQRFKCGSKVMETTLMEEAEDESEEDNEFSDEDTEDAAPTNVRMNLRKVKEMIPQMFTDKDDAYISSDDEETEQSIAKQHLFEKSEEQAIFLSPAEDKDSKEVFSLIKKLNILPDPRKRTKTSALSEMRLIGVSRAVSSKSSFLGRGSNHSLPLPQKRGSSVVRSFVFERDDGKSNGAISVLDGSSDTVQRENRPKKSPSTRLYNSQVKSTIQTAKAEDEKSTALFEILRGSSVKSSRCTKDSVVGHTESALATFRLEKPMKRETNLSIRTL